MNIDQELAQRSSERDTVLTIGVFDGVHRGHHHLMTNLMVEAHRSGRLAGVVTFRNHPASVLRPDFRPRYLSTVDERLRLIKELGVDFIVPITFDLELSRLRARRFTALLQERLQMRDLVIGPDFTMGYEREGDAKTLASLGREMGFSLHVVEPLVDEGGRAIRSTTVREALAIGDVTRVAAQMGRNFELMGTVVTGLGRGAPLGFPTANIQLPQELAVPGDGIYATWAHVGKRRYMAATSIGERPTFEESGHTIEAFILDYHGDLYDRQIRLEFVRRLRDEVKFDSVRALQEQVGRDVDQTRSILTGGSRGGPGIRQVRQ
jgi:riboflavin kinase/FMN adenylyltransferase